MAVITLTTDLGLKDYYISAVKGSLICACPNAVVIDISHTIPQFDTETASYLLKNCYKDFPKGSVHIIDVNTGFSDDTPYLLVYADGHYFIGSDNGIFSLILEDKKPEKIISIDTTSRFKRSLFPSRDIFSKVAGMIINGKQLSEIGSETKNITEKINLSAYSDAETIRGMVVYIDSYGNAITNISDNLFENARKGRTFGVQLKPSAKYSSEYGSTNFEINEIGLTYDNVTEGEVVALFNSSGFLEIAINKGNASSLLGLKNREIIRVNFYDNKIS